MTKKKPLVIVTRRLPDVIETRMRELFDAELNVSDQPMSQADLVQAVQKADVLVPTVTDRIDASVLAQAGESLRLIANFGNGVDNVDVQSALARGITVTNTPGVLTDDTADMTMALIMAAGHCRHGPQRLRRRPPRTGHCPAGSLSQPPPRARRDGRGGGRHLLGLA